MFQTFKNAFKIPDLKKKILFTLFIIVLYRVGSAIPVPFVDGNMLKFVTDYGTNNGIFTMLNTLSGGAMSQATLFALGVQPYINASIIIQLLSIAIPALEKLSKEGEEGKKKLNTITRFVTIALALVMSIGYYMLLRNNAIIGLPMLSNDHWFAGVVIVACYCAGASLVMWLAEKINESGIGNGISIILFANIIARLPHMLASVWMTASGMFAAGGLGYLWGALFIIAIVVLMIALVAFVVFVTESERRIPIQYAKRVVGRKMYGGQSPYLPIKLNMTGVMPIIFASTICSLPATILMFVDPNPTKGITKFISDLFNPQTSVFYLVLYLVLIVAFAYFYVAISFNPIEVANNIKNNGGSIIGIRPGKPTSDYISKVLSKITLIGAIFLGIIAALPMVLTIINPEMFASLSFGGSSLLIVVGVALETAREIEAQMTMRHYKGFLD